MPNKVTVIEITDSREIPAVPGGKIQSASHVFTEDGAESWAKDEGILTVYWHKGIATAFGYAGK